MTRIRSGLILVAALAPWSSAVAADEPPQAGVAAEPAPQVEPSATDATPRPTIPAAPATPEPAAPLVARPVPAQPSAGAAAPATVGADASTASARDPRFGDAGQVALNGTLSASLGHLGYDHSNSSRSSFGVEPAFDYFASENFSQGATAFFRYANDVGGTGLEITSATAGLTARVGQNFWLGRRVSLWPKLAVGAWRSWLTYSASTSGFTVNINGTAVPIGPSTKVTEDAVFVEVQVPFLFHLAQHFFVGIGPAFYVDVLHSVESSSNRRRFVGVTSTVGGWF